MNGHPLTWSYLFDLLQRIVYLWMDIHWCEAIYLISYKGLSIYEWTSTDMKLFIWSPTKDCLSMNGHPLMWSYLFDFLQRIVYLWMDIHWCEAIYLISYKGLSIYEWTSTDVKLFIWSPTKDCLSMNGHPLIWSYLFDLLQRIVYLWMDIHWYEAIYLISYKGLSIYEWTSTDMKLFIWSPTKDCLPMNGHPLIWSYLFDLLQRIVYLWMDIHWYEAIYLISYKGVSIYEWTSTDVKLFIWSPTKDCLSMNGHPLIWSYLFDFLQRIVYLWMDIHWCESIYLISYKGLSIYEWTSTDMKLFIWSPTKDCLPMNGHPLMWIYLFDLLQRIVYLWIDIHWYEAIYLISYKGLSIYEWTSTDMKLFIWSPTKDCLPMNGHPLMWIYLFDLLQRIVYLWMDIHWYEAIYLISYKGLSTYEWTSTDVKLFIWSPTKDCLSMNGIHWCEAIYLISYKGLSIYEWTSTDVKLFIWSPTKDCLSMNGHPLMWSYLFDLLQRIVYLWMDIHWCESIYLISYKGLSTYEWTSTDMKIFIWSPTKDCLSMNGHPMIWSYSFYLLQRIVYLWMDIHWCEAIYLISYKGLSIYEWTSTDVKLFIWSPTKDCLPMNGHPLIWSYSFDLLQRIDCLGTNIIFRTNLPCWASN